MVLLLDDLDNGSVKQYLTFDNLLQTQDRRGSVRLVVKPTGYTFLCFGSSLSRSQSPSRFMDNTVSRMANPG